MYWDEGVHATPHFHAHHAGTRASVDVDGRLIAGDIDGAALRSVQEWAKAHRPNSWRIGNELEEPILSCLSSP